MRNAPISSVYRMGPKAEAQDPLEQWGRVERMRREAWRRHGLILVKPEELPEPLASGIRAWAEGQL